MDRIAVGKKIKELYKKRMLICPYCESEQITKHFMHAQCRTCNRTATFAELKQLVKEYEDSVAQEKA